MTRAQGRHVQAVATQPEEFDASYRDNLPFGRRYVARRLDDPCDVADVIADIYLGVLRSAATYRPRSGPRPAWLIGTARHPVADHRRVGANRAQAFLLVGRHLRARSKALRPEPARGQSCRSSMGRGGAMLAG